MNRRTALTWFFATVAAVATSLIADSSHGEDKAPARRKLRVALYPYVPERAEMYWQLKTDFEDKYPEIDLQVVDLQAAYYDGQLVKTLQDAKAEVVEVDTVFLNDLVSQSLLEELPSEIVAGNDFLPFAKAASDVAGKHYGVPHWVCGNFLFFRGDDPKNDQLRKVKSIKDLERILGHPGDDPHALLADFRGKSTLGEEYFAALLDRYKTPNAALAVLDRGGVDRDAKTALNHIFALCPAGLCESDKHHSFGQYYPRHFAERKARCLIGYSEQMYFVVDHFLHGIRDDEPAVGKIDFVWNEQTSSYDPKATADVEAVAAPFGNNGSQLLSWVDAFCIRKGVTDQQRRDCANFIRFFNSQARTASFLTPEYGHAPRYLLPALKAIYKDDKLLKAAPLYKEFESIISNGVTVTGPKLSDKLRKVGKDLETKGFDLEEK